MKRSSNPCNLATLFDEHIRCWHADPWNLNLQRSANSAISSKTESLSGLPPPCSISASHHASGVSDYVQMQPRAIQDQIQDNRDFKFSGVLYLPKVVKTSSRTIPRPMLSFNWSLISARHRQFLSSVKSCNNAWRAFCSAHCILATLRSGSVFANRKTFVLVNDIDFPNFEDVANHREKTNGDHPYWTLMYPSGLSEW